VVAQAMEEARGAGISTSEKLAELFNILAEKLL
jgi:hypothetical protein